MLVYTRWLKRSTPQNIVIGGAAGAVPPLVGWAAATGNLALPALFLFLIVFFWTPPHFWALALLIKRDYAEAGVPMLPVVKGERETARAIVGYSLVLVGDHAPAGRLADARPGLPRRCARPRARVPRAGLRAPSGPDAGARAAALQLLARLPRAALRGHGGRPGLSRLAMEPELSRRNVRLGLLLLGVALVLFAGSIVVAVVYNALS